MPCIQPVVRRGFVRLHRKICVVDHLIAFVGGINILNDYRYDYNKKSLLTYPRQDFAVLVEGPLAMRIYQEAIRLWEQTGKRTLWERFDRYRAIIRTRERFRRAKTGACRFYRPGQFPEPAYHPARLFACDGAGTKTHYSGDSLLRTGAALSQCTGFGGFARSRGHPPDRQW